MLRSFASKSNELSQEEVRTHQQLASKEEAEVDDYPNCLDFYGFGSGYTLFVTFAQFSFWIWRFDGRIFEREKQFDNNQNNVIRRRSVSFFSKCTCDLNHWLNKNLKIIQYLSGVVYYLWVRVIIRGSQIVCMRAIKWILYSICRIFKVFFYLIHFSGTRSMSAKADMIEAANDYWARLSQVIKSKYH